MQKKLLWKIGGEAGFGIMTTGLLFAKIASRKGYHIFDYHEYPSLIRGGHNTYEVLVADYEVHASQQNVDILICLNKETYALHKHRLTPTSLIVYDNEDFTIEENNGIKISIPFKKILAEEKGIHIMLNNIALGASLALMRWDFDMLGSIIEKNFARKGPEIVALNKKVAERGYNYIKDTFPQYVHSHFPKREGEEKKMVVTGNDVFSIGSVVADCRLYSAYPMTPSSTILTTLASYADKVGMIVRHAEDEISVINTAIGSSWAGVRSAVGTSGGGFALMVETLSFAGVAEIPLVVFLGQRPGPATGMPTWTEQGDLLFAVHAGHGEFPKIILAPGDVDEMITMTLEAFDLADIYQTPVIIISDRFLCESHRSISFSRFQSLCTSYQPQKGKIISFSQEQKYLRYQLNQDGISPLLIPGQEGHFYQSNSYEHEEDGHTTEHAHSRIQSVNKRAQKMNTYLSHHFKPPAFIGDGTSEIVFVSWGGNKGIIREAMTLLEEKGIRSSYIHFTHLYPMDEEKIKPFFIDKKRYILIENNSHAQLGKLIRQETSIDIKEKLLKYDGRPFYPEEIADYIIKMKK